jgi:anthranilate/para-aminobenzoate synthase component II
VPPGLEVTATDDEGEIMAVAHREWPVIGVQFHPESVLTEEGYTLMENFLAMTPREATSGG